MLSRFDRDKVARCHGFLCLITEHWLAKRGGQEQLSLALALGKPVIALIKSGVRLPPALLSVLAQVETHAWSTPQDLEAIMQMLEQRHPQGVNLVLGPV